MSNPVICLVTWDDAMMVGHWQDGGPNPKEDLVVYTAGFLLDESGDRLIIVQSLTDGSFGNQIQIPKGMVRKVVRISLG